MVKTGKQKTLFLWENMEEQNHKQERKHPNLNNGLQQQAAANVILKNSVHNRHALLLKMEYVSTAFLLPHPQYFHGKLSLSCLPYLFSSGLHTTDPVLIKLIYWAHWLCSASVYSYFV